MKIRILSILLILVPILLNGVIDYSDFWNEIELLEKDGLYRSALDSVDNIFMMAEKENNYDQLIKAVIFKMNYLGQLDEESDTLFFQEINDFISRVPAPAANILRSFSGEAYLNFLNANYYKIIDRTDTSESSDNIRTWTINQLVKKALDELRLSLENPHLMQKQSLKKFPSLINEGNTSKRRLTLYDFIIHRTLDLLQRDNFGTIKPRGMFSLNKEEYYSQIEQFIGLNLLSEDTLSFKYNSLKLYQSILEYHFREGNKEALFDTDLKRVQYLYSHWDNGNKDELYEKYLRQIILENSAFEYVTEAEAMLAKFYLSKGQLPYQNNCDSCNYNLKAFNICKSAIEKYPESRGAGLCNNIMISIEEKQASFNLEKVYLPNEPIMAKINYKNLSTIFYRIYKFSGQDREIRNHEFIEEFLGNEIPVDKGSFNFDENIDYRSHSTEEYIKGLPSGDYLFLISNEEGFNIVNSILELERFTVSHIAFITRKTENQLEIQLLDRKTGKPLEGVIAEIWNNYYDYKSRKYTVKKINRTFKSPKNGLVKLDIPISGLDDNKRFYLKFMLDNDQLNTQEFSNYFYQSQEQKSIRTHIFTDRSIYRPGQTVYFKGIVIESIEEERSASVNMKVPLEFLDVNHQSIASEVFVTNEFGSFSGSFIIPTGVLTGNFILSSVYGDGHIKVEEYKRPKFEVKFDPIETAYIVGDTVEISGLAKAFAGFNLDNADVDYRVMRSIELPYNYRFWYPSEKQLVRYGQCVTDETGMFKFSFIAEVEEVVSLKEEPIYTYEIEVNITDLNGETQRSNQYVRVGYNFLKLDLKIPEAIDLQRNKQSFDISSLNYNGTAEPCIGQIEIFKLESPEEMYQKKYWVQPDRQFIPKPRYKELFPSSVFYNEEQFQHWNIDEKVEKIEFDTTSKQTYNLKSLKKWKKGVYKVIAETKDKMDNSVTTESYFILYDSKSKELAYPKTDLFIPIKINCEPGEKAEILIGTSFENTEILFEVERNEIYKKKWLKLDSEQSIVSIPITEDDRGNVIAHFTFIRENRLYQFDQVIYVPWTNKQLVMEFKTFRDKLVPGEFETWEIKIRDHYGDKVMAELAAVLYDKSLDKFSLNNWDFNIYPTRYSSFSWNSQIGFSSVYSRRISDYHKEFVSIDPLNYPDLKFKIQWSRLFHASYHNRGRDKNFAIEGMMLQNTPDSDIEAIDAIGLPMQKGVGGSVSDEVNMEGIEIRSNFEETAFFYPQLKTDAEGNVIISFTIPQSLTRWKMMGIAHTKNLQSGLIFAELETKKDLMIIPDAPRFLREGDLLEFTAKITNLSILDLTGTAELQLFDAITMEPVDHQFQLNSSQQDFTVKQDQSTLVKWQIKIPDTISALTYRVLAKSGNFSDGEEMTLPILTNRMLVTESLPLPVRENQTKNFQLKKLLESDQSQTLKHHKLTLEYTSNPAWYAIQALPYLMEYPYECSEQIFSRFYANSLASHIANSDIRIKRVFDIWKNMPNSEALLSNLQKNQELKSLLLEETPWVLDAKNESERKKRIGLLFDLNNMSYQRDNAIEKLQESQSSNGGWPWFKGMRENRYVTQHIVAGMGHLVKLGVTTIYDKDVYEMIKDAIQYIDIRMREDYDFLLKHKKDLAKDNLGYMQIHYLYARSYFSEIKMNNRVKEAFNYYLNQADEYWLQKSIYMQGMLALSLHRYKREETPNKIMASLEERANFSEEMGMYWKDIIQGFSWYNAPIEAQALLIEAFDEVAGKDNLVDEMKIWLLKQKQTQDWKTTKATVEACYALLLRGTDYLAETHLPEITMGNKRLDFIGNPDMKIEAGTGYFKTSWDRNEIDPIMGNIDVTNLNNVVSWGALYWQYFEDLDKITPHKTPLVLKKQIYIEEMTDSGKLLIPVTSERSPEIGDRIIVRIELHVDRDLEFVHMKDMRASCMEPEHVISNYKSQDGLGYYESIRDASTNFFFDYLPKGTYVFEYPLRVTHNGVFSNGITTIQSMYAPEFSSHSQGIKVKIEGD